MYIPVRIEAHNFGPFEELKYYFKQGQTVIVEGENRTDEGQENNGTGKSFLQEILYYCLLGSSSSGKRDIKLIRRGEKEAEILFELQNDFYGHTLTIQRKLFRSKSSILKVLINGKEQSDMFPTVAEGNKYILSLLDISPEDLKNYFLINRDKFVSFFSSADSKKRDLIARFSSANRVEGIEAIINDEIKALEKGREVANTMVTSLTSKIEVFQEEIEQLQQKDLQGEFEQKKAELERKIESIKSRIKSLQDGIQEARKRLLELELSQEREQGLYSIYCRGKERLNKINYSQSIQLIDEEIRGLRQQAKVQDKAIDDKSKEKSELIKSIQPFIIALKGQVTCPNCKTPFIPNSDISLSDAEELIPLSEEAIKELEREIKKLEEARDEFIKLKISDKILQITILEGKTKKRSNLISQIESFQRQLGLKISQIESKINSVKKEIVKGELEVTAQETSLQATQELLSTLKLGSIDDVRIKELEGRIEKHKEEIETITEDLLNVENSIAEKKKWILLMKQFYVYLTNKSLATIEGFCNLFLQDIKTDLQVKFEGFKTLADGSTKESITPMVFRDGIEEEDYRCFSGGERGRLILATILAFQQLINQKSNSGGLGLIMIDEVLDQVDAEGIYNLVTALKGVDMTILLTSQVKTKVDTDNVLTIVKDNGISYIKTN